ncbi:MAG TPA: dienelactone hydrolase family protein [Anaerolineae bacterium]|nr:dienelactone hydrolase family protein [Anaerolineae bacterium]
MTDFKGYLLDEFVEDYQEGHLSRREALKLIAGLTGSLALANTILAACAPSPAATSTATPASASQATDAPTPLPAQPTATAEQPAETPGAAATQPASGEIEASDVEFPGEDVTLLGYLARPIGDGPFPSILVCHENRGLTEHIKDVTRRAAQAGYVGLAVDLLSREGGSAALDESQVPGILGNAPPEQFVQDFISGWRWLQSQPYVQADQVGMVGFCFGGGVTWRVAIGLPELRAAVPFYGPHPSVDEVPDIQAAVLAIYGELDTRINQGIPAIEAAMQANNQVYEKVIYPNADHAFHNDTGSRYNAEAAQDAWARTLAWFEQYVKTS